MYVGRMDIQIKIQGYRVDLNLEKIGYEYYKLNFMMEDFLSYKDVFDFCEKNPNVIYMDKTLADYDFEIDVEVKDRQELMDLIATIKKKFSVRDLEILSFKEYLKLESIPQI